MAQLQEKYESKEVALKAFEALLVESDDDEGGVKLHEDVIKQFKVVNDTRGSLSAARKAEREARAKLKAFEEALDGREIEDLAEALDELEELRTRAQEFEAGDDKSKIDEIVEKRLDTARRQWEREKQKLERQIQEKDQALGETSGKLRSVSLERAGAELAAKHKIAKHALDDVLFRVKSEFELDDDGNPVHRSGNGQTLQDWFEEMVPNKPGWTFDPSSAGSGVTNGGGSGGKRTIRREDFRKIAVEQPQKAKDIMDSVNKGEAVLVD